LYKEKRGKKAKSLGYTEAKQPSIDIRRPSLRGAHKPEPSIFTAPLKEKRQAGSLLPEHDDVHVFPQVPTTEQSEGPGSLRGHTGSSLVGVQQVDAGIHGKAAADGRSEALGKTAPEEDVIGRLDWVLADAAKGHSSLQDGFVQQSRTGLQPISGQQPSEEADMGGGVVAPDKVMERSVDAPHVLSW
jgi:hypothetical protein